MDFRNNKLAYGSRGLRNNNPGNFRPGIEWLGISGKDEGYLIFSDIKYGIRAMALNLYNNYYLYGKTDLQSFIRKYAPSADNNNPDTYANTVADQIGISVTDDMALSFERTAAILRAMMNVELGNNYSAMITDTDISEGIKMINKFELQALKTVKTVKDNSAIAIISGSLLIGVYIYFVTRKKSLASTA